MEKFSCAAEEAYGRLSQTLGVVRQVPDQPSDQEIGKLTAAISDLPSSNWFKNVSRICDRLAVLADVFSEKIIEQRKYAANTAGPEGHNLSMLVRVLSTHEGNLKDDMRNVVWSLQNEIGSAKTKGSFSDVRALAVNIQKEIDMRIDEISKVSGNMKGTASDGAENLLEKEAAEKALQTPERMLILSMFFLTFIFSLGAFVFHFLKPYQFILVTGFALTAVIVVNAFYLRTIGKLSEKGFLSLMQLALLKFFAPLTRRTAR